MQSDSHTLRLHYNAVLYNTMGIKNKNSKSIVTRLLYQHTPIDTAIYK